MTTLTVTHVEQSMTSHPLRLYIWPHSWNLPSFDPDSLACVLYLQIHFPNAYELVECTDPDLSNACVLPFLRHEDTEIVTTRGILKYLESLHGEGGDRAGAGVEEKLHYAKRIAWESYVDTHLKEVTNAILYADPDNYRAGIHAVLSSKLSFPTRYYLSRRLRDQVRASLDPVGLWRGSSRRRAGSNEDEDDDVEPQRRRPFDKVKTIVDEKDKLFDEAFQNEKLLEKTREILDVLNPLLGHSSFFLSEEEPSSLDCQVAACVLIVEHAPLPKNTLRTLLHEAYPRILQHAERMMSLAFPPLSDEQQQGTSAPKVSRAVHANPAVQLGRALRRVVDSIL
ncbi:hypothetical protein FRC17_005401 [Serendipita sp. 399]|nr:hypothetical protein FRC17_005401 [Serendipita sp. 399]